MEIDATCPKCKAIVRIDYAMTDEEFWMMVEQNAHMVVMHRNCSGNSGDCHWSLTSQNKKHLLKQRFEGRKFFEL
jgi:hypothetical protein